MVIALMCVSSVLAAPATLSTIDLDNEIGSAASGVVYLKESKSTYGNKLYSIQVKVKNLLPENARVYEVALEDTDTGYVLNLGELKVTKNGVGQFLYKMPQTNIDLYDRIIISQKPLFEDRPQPGMHILTADLPFFQNINVTMEAKIRGIYEVPKRAVSATGVGTFLVDREHNVLYYDILINGPLDETAAHIHGFAKPGQNAGVLFALPIGNHKVGSWNFPADFEDEILAGETYVNIHTTQFLGGAIRGQIVPQ